MNPLAALTQSIITAFSGGNIGDMIVACLLIAVAIVGAASMIVRGLAMIADITPTTKDDLYVSKVQAALSAVSAFLDRLALNPDRNSARPPDATKRL